MFISEVQLEVMESPKQELNVILYEVTKCGIEASLADT